MTLQDQIETFQRLIFAKIHGELRSECKVSALVPLVQESYGIYKFITSMLRAMHRTTGNEEALAPLRERYDGQHHRLARFYYECSNLRYLTSLITIPKLPQDPPNLLSEDDAPPALPQRPANEPGPASTVGTIPEPDSIQDFWSQEEQQRQHAYEEEQARQRAYEEEQRRLEQQRQAEIEQQQYLAMQQQREFEEQQRQLAEQQRQAQEQLMRDQYNQQAQGQFAELQRQLLEMQGQNQNNLLTLDQYQKKIQALETEIANLNHNAQQQQSSKDDLIRTLQEQVNLWKSKYEALAKLYSQLRHEHLELLGKFKQMQLKAKSAQEAIEKREKLEREMKSKNLELADMIRERDRALYDLDRVKGGQKEEVEKLKREIKMLEEKSDNNERSKGTELSSLLSRHNREITDLEELLRAKQRQIDELASRQGERNEDAERLLREKEEELEMFKAGMDEVLIELNTLRQVGSVTIAQVLSLTIVGT